MEKLSASKPAMQGKTDFQNAEEIFDSIDGFGTKDEKLQRIFITRSEVDLISIDHVFKKMFGKKLEKAINEETSGHYKDALLGILEAHKKWK